MTETHVLPLDPESERRLARAVDRVREEAHEARRRRHGSEVRLTIALDEAGHVTGRSRVQVEEPLADGA
jgi:hypothetical protein